MSSSRLRRVAKELSDIETEARDLTTKFPNKTLSELNILMAGPANGDDLTHLKGRIAGPADTPYAGGWFIVDIVIPNEYPFKAPTMKFDTKVWHPNISSQTGAICLDTLGNAWSPVLTIKSALLSLQSLFQSPEPKDPQDAEVAQMMLNDFPSFQKKAHDWAVKHAGAPPTAKYDVRGGAPVRPRPDPEVDFRRYQGYNKNLIDRFVVMGFDVDKVVEAFQHFGIATFEGQDYELEPEYMGDVTARLLGEP
ncbi:putative ubiquitin carrier protein [Xylariaceae sp. FL1272]|nr:putative ubiquitin carrier protein [Xylariaceae sp. FL1272]